MRTALLGDTELARLLLSDPISIGFNKFSLLTFIPKLELGLRIGLKRFDLSPMGLNPGELDERLDVPLPTRGDLLGGRLLLLLLDRTLV